MVRVSRRVGRVAGATTDPKTRCVPRPSSAARPPPALRTVRATRRTGRASADAYPPRTESARGILSSIRSRAATRARCNTPAEAEATFARRVWPTPNRSWPAPDASALGRCACWQGGGARASTFTRPARPRAQLKASRRPDGPSRLPLNGFTYF